MRALLDTHAFVWFMEGSERLSQKAQNVIEDPNTECYLSIASLWEMGIKAGKGRLRINKTLSDLVEHHVWGNDIGLMRVKIEHVEATTNLPFHHKDPFDRMLIAQAQVEGLSLISCDAQFPRYNVELFW